MHARIVLRCNFYWNKEFSVHTQARLWFWGVGLFTGNLCWTSYLTIHLRNYIISPWVTFPYFHNERGRAFLALLLRLLCSLPEAVWPCFVCDAQIISQLHKDPEAEGGDPSEGPVMYGHTHTHTRCHSLEAWLTKATAKNEASQDRFTHK